MPNGKTLGVAIREAAKRDGLGVEQYRLKHSLPNASFYSWLRNGDPIPGRTTKALRRLRDAGVRHPLLEAV